MEDLGTININIKDMGSAGRFGGGGGPGGGPGPVVPRIVPVRPSMPVPMPPPLPEPTAPPKTMWERVLGRLGQVEEGSLIKGEMLSFVRSPSIGGMASLFSTSASTGKAIAALGAAAAPVAVVVGAALVGVAGTIAAYNLLSASADLVRRRFDEITRFSGAMMFAQANERLSQFRRQLTDASVNGTAYARAQFYATQASDAQAAMMIHVNAAAAELSVVFSQLWTAVYRTLTPLAQFAAWLTKATDWGTVLLSAFTTMLSATFPTLSVILNGILIATKTTAQNTTPKGAGSVNNWFMGDIQAITRRNYAAM